MHEYQKSLAWLAGCSSVAPHPSTAATCRLMVSPVSMTNLELYLCHASHTMLVVLSVQILVNLSVLKGWGLNLLDDLSTFAEVLEQFKRGEIEGCSSFVFPDTLQEQLLPFECCIAPNLSGPFQTVFRCARVGKIHAIGCYLLYVITPSDKPAFADIECQGVCVRSCSAVSA